MLLLSLYHVFLSPQSTCFFQYLDLHRNDDALKAWDKAIKYKPTHIAAWSNTLVLLYSMRLYQEAIKLGRTALMHNPKSPALHFSIANTLGKLQRFEEAEKHFMEALNLNPHNALYHSNLGNENIVDGVQVCYCLNCRGVISPVGKTR